MDVTSALTHLITGALRAPFKRPSPDADFPRARLTLPGVRVDLSRLAAYERVCGFPTGESGLPVTYPHVLGFPLAMRLMSDRAFPLPLPGLVHTSIDIVRHGVVPPTDAYELAVHIEGLAPHRRGTEATVVTELRSRGERLWESRSTYLARHHTQEAVSGHREERRPAPALPVLDQWRLAGDVGRRYGAASGDRNPIHLHPLTARLFGFPRAIAHGMWTVARCVAAHGTSGSVMVRARFMAPVLLPGVVTYGADASGRFELRDSGGERVHVRGEVRGVG
ncbi:MaoC/PaaZ C-terminal domain-containing protein [Streptomyces monashensis]|uniref:MaoC-like domain-containing protein n=1 Tax=Streptomyces monashensis TaxID=1678012 RepID=A0A1S2Q6I6_9ACTN|nr:MaoC/PaaZ C-terminal domain-containing protein [Streptomyces monashensis]OIK01231.1 hypothetical protein BIV23_26185 [Streptomyces monashensis]